MPHFYGEAVTKLLLTQNKKKPRLGSLYAVLIFGVIIGYNDIKMCCQ